MLTGEIFGALVALSFAWSGMGGWPLLPSYLHRALDRTGETELWSIVIGIPALVLLVVSMREYWAIARPPADPAKRWSLIQIDRSVRIRGRMCLVMAASWAYMFKVMLELSVLRDTANHVFEGVRANAIMPIALFGCLCMFWSWLENRRVQRDVRKATGHFPAYPAR
jgi:MFS family permease